MGRKEKKYHYIYKTVNILSGKYYIGMHSTNNLNDGYLGSGTRLRYSINKHGKDNHKLEILEFCNSIEELYQREAEIVNLNEIAKIDCMNLCVGGRISGFMNDEHRIKAQKGSQKLFKERMLNDVDFRKKMCKIRSSVMKKNHILGKINYDTMSGKKHSEETKLKMSKSSKGIGKGETNSQFGSCWITNEIENKKIKRGDLIPEGFRLGRKMN